MSIRDIWRRFPDLPVLTTDAGPKNNSLWCTRLKEELIALIKTVQTNKEADNDWFRLEPSGTGTRWFGKCWYIHNSIKYEFEIELRLPENYPERGPWIAISGLGGKTPEVNENGIICVNDGYRRRWNDNVPNFGIAHAMSFELYPWLVTKVPILVRKGIITHIVKVDVENKEEPISK